MPILRCSRCETEIILAPLFSPKYSSDRSLAALPVAIVVDDEDPPGPSVGTEARAHILSIRTSRYRDATEQWSPGRFPISSLHLSFDQVNESEG